VKRRAQKETNTLQAQKDKKQPTLLSQSPATRCHRDHDARRAAARRHAAPNAATHKSTGKQPEQIAA
jgi:hypothetical protein